MKEDKEVRNDNYKMSKLINELLKKIKTKK